MKNSHFSLDIHRNTAVSKWHIGFANEICRNINTFHSNQPKYDCIVKVRGRLLHKNTFLDHQAYREGLSFIHKVKKIENNYRKSASPSRRNEKNSQTDFDNESPKGKPKQDLSIFLTPVKKSKKNFNQSQQTLILEEPTTAYGKARNYSTLTDAKYSQPFKIHKKPNQNLLGNKKSGNISGWESELEQFIL